MHFTTKGWVALSTDVNKVKQGRKDHEMLKILENGKYHYFKFRQLVLTFVFQQREE